MRIIFSFIWAIMIFSCDTTEDCVSSYSHDRASHGNLVVTQNISKTSPWRSGGLLKLRGINVTTGEEIKFVPKSRSWNTFANKIINPGDTVVKLEGKPYMYIYKKDSIVKIDLSENCKRDFDWEKDFQVTLRDSTTTEFNNR